MICFASRAQRLLLRVFSHSSQAPLTALLQSLQPHLQKKLQEKPYTEVGIAMAVVVFVLLLWYSFDRLQLAFFA